MKIINQKNEECVMSCLLRDLDKLDAVRESDFSNTELKDWYRKLKRMRAEGYHSVINEDEYDKYGDFGRYIAFYYNKDTDCSYAEIERILERMITRGDLLNWSVYLTELKKTSLVRGLKQQGFNVEKWWNEDGPTEDFAETKLENIRSYYQNKLDKVNVSGNKFQLKTIYEYEEANEPIEWIVDGIIQKRSFNELVAPSKAGKSQLSYQLAYEVANGKDFLGIFKTNKCKVIYFDFEMNANEIKHRVDMLKAFEEIKEDVYFVPVRKMESDDLEAIIQFCINSKKQDDSIGLVVFDNFYSLCGAANTNDMSETNAILDLIKYLLAENGLTTILVNHTNKATALESIKAGDGDITDTTILNSAFGSMAHGAKVDTAILIQRKAEGRRIHISGRKCDKPIRISCHYGPETNFFFRPIRGEDEGVEEIINRMTEEQINTCKEYLMGEKKRLTSFDAWTDKNLNKKFTKEQLRACGFEVFKDSGNYYIRVRHIFGQNITDPTPEE